MEHPSVSCIVTAYNYARYLPEALDSALAQDYPADRLEIVVVDDGSTDETPAVIEAYAGRVRSIRRENGGLNAATSTGIAAATGELLTFLDADDAWDPGRTRLLVEALRSAPSAAIAYGDMQVIDEHGGTVAPSYRAAMQLDAPSGRVFERLFVNNFVSAGAMMVRAAHVRSSVPIPAFAAHQDWWLATEVARTSELVAIPEPVNRYRRHAGNMNLGVEGERLARLYEVELPFRRWLLQGADAGLVGPGRVVQAVTTLTEMIERIARIRGCPPGLVLSPGPADRERATAALQEASEALDAERLDHAVARLGAAAGHDPLWPEPRELLAQLAPLAAASRATAIMAP